MGGISINKIGGDLSEKSGRIIQGTRKTNSLWRMG